MPHRNLAAVPKFFAKAGSTLAVARRKNAFPTGGGRCLFVQPAPDYWHALNKLGELGWRLVSKDRFVAPDTFKKADAPFYTSGRRRGLLSLRQSEATVSDQCRLVASDRRASKFRRLLARSSAICFTSR
jgi:hypothetical protein